MNRSSPPDLGPAPGAAAPPAGPAGPFGPLPPVLPGLPLAHYMTETKPTIQLDWEHDGEMMFAVGTKAVLERLSAQQTTVFVEKSNKEEAFIPPGNYKCSALEHILLHWHKVEENAHFEVYVEQVPDSAGIMTP